jgi:hypothetical protein
LPASSTSASLSWGLYLMACVLLVASLHPTATAVYTASQKHALLSVADGIAAELCSLHDGMGVELALNSPVPGTVVVLSGHEVTASSGGLSEKAICSLPLDNETLLPGVSYFAYLGDGEVQFDV